MSLKEEHESESKSNKSESPEFTNSMYEHTDLSEEPSNHEHKNIRANSERAHSPAPSYMSLSSDWSMDLPTNFKSGETIPLGLNESKKRICDLPELKHDHVEIRHLSKEPSDEHKNIRVKSERSASPAPSYMSLRTDLSMDPPTNFKDCLLDASVKEERETVTISSNNQMDNASMIRLRSERAPSPTLSLWSDWSAEPSANCKTEEPVHLDSRLSTSHHFRCPVCKSMLKDPVSISCGHNYCRGCINEFWDNCAGDYVCPQCGNPSETRPVLNTNAALAEVVKSLQQASFSPALPPQSYAGLGDVACDYCTEHRLKAVKCCLTCVMSLCETHVKPHYTIAALQKHTLSDVTGDMKTSPSEQHQNTDNSFSSTVSGQQDQTVKTEDVIEDDVRSMSDSVLNTCASETEVSKDDTNVSSLAPLCSKQQDDLGHKKSLSKLNENDKKKEEFNVDKTYHGEDHEYDYEDYSENDFGADNCEVEPEEYDHFDVEGDHIDDYDDGDNYDYEGGIIDDYNDIPDCGDYYDDYD